MKFQPGLIVLDFDNDEVRLVRRAYDQFTPAWVVEIVKCVCPSFNTHAPGAEFTLAEHKMKIAKFNIHEYPV